MSSLKTIVVQVTPFVQNCSILFCTKSNKCAFVDPGGDIEVLLDTAKKNNLIWGCGKPLRFDGENVMICDYI